MNHSTLSSLIFHLSLVCLLLVACSSADDLIQDAPADIPAIQPPWTHQNQLGWSSDFPQCDGNKVIQSPINIQTNTVVTNPALSLNLLNYDQDLEFVVVNQIHSIGVILTAPTKPSIKPNWIAGEFGLDEIHFHWDDGNRGGSEHGINGRKSMAEMHLVHKLKGYEGSNLGKIPNSIMVIGVFLEPPNGDLTSVDLETIFSVYMRAVNGTEERVSSEGPVNPSDFLPVKSDEFYTYQGSLTTPPCSPVVNWIVMRDPVFVDDKYIMRLATLDVPGEEGVKIGPNHREFQPLLGRIVQSSFNQPARGVVGDIFDIMQFGRRIVYDIIFKFL